MSRSIELAKKVGNILKNEGPKSLAKKSFSYVKATNARIQAKKYDGKIFKDVLFINGVNFNQLPHPPRYRVLHQLEQLRANNMDCDQRFFMELYPDLVRMYRAFIVYRAPYTEQLGEFIRLAKSLNKTVIYDIDDLVIDTKYTDTIKYLDTMSNEEREGYNQGVRDMQKTLKMCDAVITTTERMASELKHYCPIVFINRNTASEEMVRLSEDAYKELKNQVKPNQTVKMGYFSGSITHNDDFILIQPAVQQIMSEFQNVELHIVGLLDIPKEFEGFKERVIAHPFMDWKALPKLIGKMDINLAPLENNLFNEAKSENKWVEAALVRVPTVASNVGAFKKMMQQNLTGLLCDSTSDWYEALKLLITNPEVREELGQNAYRYCVKNCTTIYTGYPLKEFIKGIMNKNIAFVLPSLNISGGVMVAFEHAGILKRNGYDVTIINCDLDKRLWIDFSGERFPVIPRKYAKFKGSFDKAVSTAWFTNEFLEKYMNIHQRFYLVQGFETDFYEAEDPFKSHANKTYSPIAPMQFLTVSKWCQDWLKSRFEKDSRYVPNGLHRNNYLPVERDFSGKIRILIEGDCSMYYKNVDESFEVANRLPKDKFEIWYLTYNAEPKEWYQVDKFLSKVPFEKVSNVYKQCHILLKTSILESFSYPPLEMMATGGYVVAIPNDGNSEYLQNEKNCLLFESGHIQEGLNSILRICEDAELRNILYKNGLETADRHDWKNLEEDIVNLYR